MSYDMSFSQAKQIAANAYQFAQDHLLPDKLYCYFYTLLKVRSPDCHVQVRYLIQSYYSDALSCDLHTILYFNHVTSILYCILIMWLTWYCILIVWLSRDIVYISCDWHVILYIYHVNDMILYINQVTNTWYCILYTNHVTGMWYITIIID